MNEATNPSTLKIFSYTRKGKSYPLSLLPLETLTDLYLIEFLKGVNSLKVAGIYTENSVEEYTDNLKQLLFTGEFGELNEFNKQALVREIETGLIFLKELPILRRTGIELSFRGHTFLKGGVIYKFDDSNIRQQMLDNLKDVYGEDSRVYKYFDDFLMV